MTIAKHIETTMDTDFDIYLECELEFADPENASEARENLQWVLDNEPTLRAICIVVSSYYGDTIDWERM